MALDLPHVSHSSPFFSHHNEHIAIFFPSMAVADTQLDALCDRIKYLKEKYHWDPSKEHWPGPENKIKDARISGFPPSGLHNPTGLLTPTAELEGPDYLGPPRQDLADNYEEEPAYPAPWQIESQDIRYQMPSPKLFPENESLHRTSTHGNPSYVDWALDPGSGSPHDYIRDMTGAQEPRLMTRGMSHDLRGRSLRKQSGRRPYYFALDSAGRIAVTSVGEDMEAQSELSSPYPLFQSSSYFLDPSSLKARSSRNDSMQPPQITPVRNPKRAGITKRKSGSTGKQSYKRRRKG